MRGKRHKRVAGQDAACDAKYKLDPKHVSYGLISSGLLQGIHSGVLYGMIRGILGV